MKLFKKYKSLLLLICFMFFFSNISAQEKLPSFFSEQPESSLELTSITQISEQNFNITDQNTNRLQISNVKLNQLGNENTIKLDLPRNGSQTVTQFGNQNFYQFSKHQNNTPTTLKVNQIGDTNSLKILGNNSLINNLTITQTKGSALTIVNY